MSLVISSGTIGPGAAPGPAVTPPLRRPGVLVRDPVHHRRERHAPHARGHRRHRRPADQPAGRPGRHQPDRPRHDRRRRAQRGRVRSRVPVEQDWVEIVNVSGADLSIGGWKVRDLEGNSFTVPVRHRAPSRWSLRLRDGLGPGRRRHGHPRSTAPAPRSTGSTGSTHAASGTWSRCVEGMGSFLDSAPSKGTANPCRGPDITASISSTTPITANGWYGARSR